MVECRYSTSGDAKQSLASVGYMVKTPPSTLPTSVISSGLYSVELRMAEGWVLCKKYNEQFLLSICKLSISWHLLLFCLIPTDQTYSKYLATTSQPLRLLLGKPVYLELRLKSPKPDAVILVNYCIAYPRSAKNALVLVYEG